ncbi:hypothetical protein YC2023_005094 [Brassica napus]
MYYILGSSDRFADLVTRSFSGATVRWVNGIRAWSRLFGFRAQVYFSLLIWSLTEASGGVLLLCLYGGLRAEKSDEGIDVAVAPRNPGSADVYFLRQRALQTFFYSVARAGLCAAVWWRVISGSGVCCVFMGVGALKS